MSTVQRSNSMPIPKSSHPTRRIVSKHADNFSDCIYETYRRTTRKSAVEDEVERELARTWRRGVDDVLTWPWPDDRAYHRDGATSTRAARRTRRRAGWRSARDCDGRELIAQSTASLSLFSATISSSPVDPRWPRTSRSSINPPRLSALTTGRAPISWIHASLALHTATHRPY